MEILLLKITVSILNFTFLLSYRNFLAIEHVRSVAIPTNSFYGLDLRNGNWHEISDSGNKLPTPRDKTTGFSCSKGLFFFGGYGPGNRHLRNPENYLYKNDDFLEDDELLNNCWNNQLLHFNGTKWNLIEQSGSIPPQRAAASIAYNPSTNKVMISFFLYPLFILSL